MAEINLPHKIEFPNDKFGTKETKTWCPGCTNYSILSSVKKALVKLTEQGIKQEDIVITTDIGCSSKIYDYLNVSGIYGLHGRALATGFGITLGNPNLKVIAFAGDGGVYSEGISHFIHAGRFNPNMTLIVHDNQNFALTTGQPTPTSPSGYISKSEPLGEFNEPLNPIKLTLASNVSFIARCYARDIDHTSEILEKAIKHKGFSFVEIIQDCIIFGKEISERNKLIYKISDNSAKIKAEELAKEWDYNSKSAKIPIGIIYQEKKLTLAEKWPQLKELLDKKCGWKNI